MPGLQFGLAHGSGLPELKFQGSAGGYVLFMIDGERVAGEGSSNNIDYNLIDMDNVERIEIVKGPMSTLYGSQAMGGVVNIITKDANRPFTGNVSVRYGNNDESKYSLSLGAKQGRFSINDAYSLEDIREGKFTILKIEDVLNYESITLDGSLLKKVSNGVKIKDIWNVKDRVVFKDSDGKLLVIYKKDGVNLKIDKMIYNYFI